MKGLHGKHHKRIRYFINYLKNLGYFFPEEVGFDCKFFLEFISSRKRVNKIYYN